MFHADPADSKVQTKLKRLNERGSGIYMAINEMDGEGRKLENVKRIRAVWAELDDGLPDRSWPIEPSIVCQSSEGKYHFYWLLKDDESLTEDEFRIVMARMVADYKHDKNACDPTRVLRVPGFYNCKIGKYKKLQRVEMLFPEPETEKV